MYPSNTEFIFLFLFFQRTCILPCDVYRTSFTKGQKKQMLRVVAKLEKKKNKKGNFLKYYFKNAL